MKVESNNNMIPHRFSATVREHLVLSLIELDIHPVVMGIFGRPGEGKTYQLRRTLHTLGVEVVSISAAELESDRAGTPGKTLLASYVNASRAISKRAPTCIVIDDVDTTVGEWENNTGTVNHQQLLAQLMHLADSPCHVEKIGRVHRVPVFLTGNDFSKLYAPLRRPGRLMPFHWQPTLEERTNVVLHILHGLLPESQIVKLLDEYNDLPISFFAEFRSRLVSTGAQHIINQLADNLTIIAGEPERYRSHVFQAASQHAANGVANEIAANLQVQHRSMLRSHLTTD